MNEETFTTPIEGDVTVHRVAATEIAADLGNRLGGSMVMVGAYAGVTRLVGIDSLVAAMRAIRPVPCSTPSERVRAARGWDLLPTARSGVGVRRRSGRVSESQTRGTVTIATERCKGCELCIPRARPTC